VLFSRAYIPYIHIVHAFLPFFQAKATQNQKETEATWCRSRSIRGEPHHVRDSDTPGIKETSIIFSLCFMMEKVR
jgi:hypothetical protein